jgi:hypothetical protein
MLNLKMNLIENLSLLNFQKSNIQKLQDKSLKNSIFHK